MCGIVGYVGPDPALPVKDGVVLWLDAGREQAAREHQKRPILSSGMGLDMWHDASGFRRGWRYSGRGGAKR